jgi:hypothetical protein
VGGGPKIVEQEVKNDAVLRALTTINPGINHGYNKQAWKDWYATLNAPAHVNFRRHE